MVKVFLKKYKKVIIIKGAKIGISLFFIILFIIKDIPLYILAPLFPTLIAIFKNPEKNAYEEIKKNKDSLDQ